MTRTVELNVLADREGRILATARPTEAEGAPSLLGFRAAEGQRAFAVELPAEQADDREFIARLATEYEIDLDVPPKAKLRTLRSR